MDKNNRLRSGAHFLLPDMKVCPENVDGHMTSVCLSPALGHWIGLGLLKRGLWQRIGERLRCYDPVRGEDFTVEVCPAVFVDPDGYARTRLI